VLVALGYGPMCRADLRRFPKVLPLRPEGQVGWVAAWAVVAQVPHGALEFVVLNPQAEGHGKPMRVVGHLATALVAWPAELSIPLARAGGPGPAFGGATYIDLYPEAILNGATCTH
jgi:hypothetical protein